MCDPEALQALEALFHEPTDDDAGEPVFEAFALAPARTLRLRFAQEHSLWAHKLWNASKVLAAKIAAGEVAVAGRSILELGAGAALPSIAAAICGASSVVCTDYPETEIVDNIRYNVQSNLTSEEQARVTVSGYLWGKDLAQALDSSGWERARTPLFDHIFMADLVFNHREHAALVDVILRYMHPEGTCHVLFSHHVPLRRDRDLRFFDVCAAKGLVVREEERVFTDRMFPEDDAQYREFPLEWRQYVFYRTIRFARK